MSAFNYIKLLKNNPLRRLFNPVELTNQQIEELLNAAIKINKKTPEFFNNLAGPTQYAFSLADVGHRYNQYQDLMKYWHNTLPIPIMDIDYDELVSNQDTISKKLINFVELDWDDECLSFYKSKRAVLTASNWQVRQPIYKTSSRRWKKYDKYLGPLKEVLGYDGHESDITT